MRSMNSTKRTILFQFKLIRCALLIFCRCIVSTFTCSTGKCNNISHTVPSKSKKKPFLTVNFLLLKLCNNFTNNSSTYGSSTLSDRETKTGIHGYRGNQFRNY